MTIGLMTAAEMRTYFDAHDTLLDLHNRGILTDEQKLNYMTKLDSLDEVGLRLMQNVVSTHPVNLLYFLDQPDELNGFVRYER